MTRSIFALTMFALAAAGCQDHYSTQDAYAVCEDLTDRNPATNSPESFSDCVACYESCGEDCAQAGTSPETYVCPDEVDEGSAGGATD